MSYTAAVITVSDLGSRGLRQDTSGPAVRAMLEDAGFAVTFTAIVPDKKDLISTLLRECADEKKVDLVVTTGGTGLSPRDVTPEATLAVLEREIRRRHVGRGAEEHAARDALARRGGNEGQYPHSQCPRLGKGGAGESRRRCRDTRTRHAHDRRRGARLKHFSCKGAGAVIYSFR